MTIDLFDHKERQPAPTSALIGIKVKLDRDIDRQKPCCQNIAVIHPGKAQHAGELRCARCGTHRGWASKPLIDFVNHTAQRFGAPAEPITIRRQEETKTMEFDNTNRRALFRNNEKTEEKHPDYRGNINVDGTEFWVSGWLKTSKNGMKYMSLSVKPKNAPAPDKSKPLTEEMNVPF